MNEIKKFGMVSKSGTGAAPTAEVMAKINALTLRELTPEDVFVFRVAACDDQVDRDFERFPADTLAELGALYVGKTIIADHVWSSKYQTARIFDYTSEKSDDITRLVLSAYMLRTDATAETIAAIEGGILKEVSVGCLTEKVICSICGTDRRRAWCDHAHGAEYGGKLCYFELTHAIDAYEVSFVAVPAQREAGVIKAYGGEANKPKVPDSGTADKEIQKALALLELEEKSL